LLCGALGGRLRLQPGAEPATLSDFYVPARHAATFPWVSHAVWFYAQMVRWRQIEFRAEHLAAVRATYRPDLYRRALQGLGVELPATDMKVERFFDGRTFDPQSPGAYAG
jgi:NitT/TauT family transport system ATP-binding protein